MATKTEKMGHALICSMGGLTRVVPVVGEAYWLRADGLIGVDLDESDAVTWYAPSVDGLQPVMSTLAQDDDEIG